MILIACGDRNWKDADLIRRVLSDLPHGTIIIEGEARGADSLARDIAIELGLLVLPFPADWNQYGKRAGPIRNHAMLDCLFDNADPQKFVYAFHNDINASKGTKHMVTIASKIGIPCFVYTTHFTIPYRYIQSGRCQQ